MRCSSAADLYASSDGIDMGERIHGLLERYAMRHTDLVYAPSELIARHFRKVHGINIRVLRPPRATPTVPGPIKHVLPDRYFIHFGQLRARKGSDFLAEALRLIWRESPEFTMVWCGIPDRPKSVERWRELWGANADKVWLTGPIPRAELAAIVARADAAVLPSLVDNLPNTVIESLAEGVPVIGTYDSSVDELVEHESTGLLVPIGDTRQLADAILRQWQGHSPVRKGFTWDSEVSESMQLETAIANFLALARPSERAR
jgi:glycogen(starch) synthase